MPTQSLPHREAGCLTSQAATRKRGAGEALNRRVGNEHEPVRCRAKHGDVESPWVTVKDWRCESAFFAYFLCDGATVKKVSAAPHRGNPGAGRRIADASAGQSEPSKKRRRQNMASKVQRPRRIGAKSDASGTLKTPPSVADTKKTILAHCQPHDFGLVYSASAYT